MSLVPGTVSFDPSIVPDIDHLYFKNDHIYWHNIMRINYTTYNVRQKQDTINPQTAHCDVMILADNEDTSDHPFLYMRVLGIFHINVVYMGLQVVDYTARPYKFLWVQWFDLDPKAPSGGWGSCALDQLCLPLMTQQDSFSFLDPEDVVRSCHVVPTFCLGRRHADGKGLSHFARDGLDWNSYYVNQ